MDNNNPTTSRRRILKGIGTSAAAGAGGVSFTTTVAAKNETTRSFRKKALRADKTRAIADELGKPHFRQADAVVLEHVDDDSGNVVIRQALFFVPAGTLVYSETGSGAADALFKFGTGREILDKFGNGNDGSDTLGMDWTVDAANRNGSKGPKTRLDRRYRNLPEGTSPMLLATETAAIFRRNATERERSIVADAVAFDVDEDVDVITGSDVNGFTVTRYEDGTDGVERSLTTVSVNTGNFDSVTTADASLGTADLRAEPETDVGTASHDIPECAGICTGCAGSVTACALCAPACANPVGPLTCPICLFPVCHGVLVASCAFCAECLSNHYF